MIFFKENVEVDGYQSETDPKNTSFQTIMIFFKENVEVDGQA